MFRCPRCQDSYLQYKDLNEHFNDDDCVAPLPVTHLLVPCANSSSSAPAQVIVTTGAVSPAAVHVDVGEFHHMKFLILHLCHSRSCCTCLFFEYDTFSVSFVIVDFSHHNAAQANIQEDDDDDNAGADDTSDHFRAQMDRMYSCLVWRSLNYKLISEYANSMCLSDSSTTQLLTLVSACDEMSTIFSGNVLHFRYLNESVICVNNFM